MRSRSRIALAVVAVLAATFGLGFGSARGASSAGPDPTVAGSASSGTASPGVTSSPGGGGRYEDTDGDGMPDRWERRHGLDPNHNDANQNPDGDGLTNLNEYYFHGDPHNPDTDGDGLRDGAEVRKYHTKVNVADAIVGRALGENQCPDQTPADSKCVDVPMFAVTVTLQDSYGTAIATKTTDPSGRFSFHDSKAPPGDYTIEWSAARSFASPSSTHVAVTAHQRRPASGEAAYEDNAGMGVAGQATRSPTCPGPQRINGPSCIAPQANVTIDVEDSKGKVVASTTTDPDGRYAISLQPGSYTLVPRPPSGQSFGGAPSPVDFMVTSSDTGPNQINVTYDTGIR